MEGLWFIALSTATSRTCALACRINTALSVLSIRHHLLSPPLPLSHTLPFHATTHKQSFIILIPSSLYLFSAHYAGPLFYAFHYFDALAWVVHLGVIVTVDVSIDFRAHRIQKVSVHVRRLPLSFRMNVLYSKSSWQILLCLPSQMGFVITFFIITDMQTSLAIVQQHQLLGRMYSK